MSKSKLPWFKCYPGDLLHALAEHSRDAQHVYVLTLLLMYEKDGPLRRDDRAMAARADMPLAAVARAYRELFDAGRLVCKRNRITNRRTLTEISERRRLSTVGREAAWKRWRKKKPAISTTADGLAYEPNALVCEPNAKEKEKEKEIEKERKGGAAHKNERGVSARLYFEQNVTIPDTFMVEAKKIGLIEPDAKKQWDRFRDWHLARGTIHVDWLATWRTWSRKFIDGFPDKRPPTNGRAWFI